EELDNILSPIYQKSINITKELLERNNIDRNNINALILVGGPTYSPILRKMLKEQVTDNVDTSVDPMTVVAKGAALFASTISVSDDVKDISRDNTKLQIDLKYEATSVEIDEMISLRILKDKSIGIFPDKIYANVTRSDGAWDSGKKLLTDKATVIDVLLEKDRSNSFDLYVFDDLGNKIECEPNKFTILQGIGGLTGMQILPFHIGIAKYFPTDNKVLFMPVKGLEKSKRYPATGIIDSLKTRTVIRPGNSQDIIRIPIYQGEYNAEGTLPELNDFINEIVITGEEFPGILPEGSNVDITIKIDSSQIMKVMAYFPLLNYTEEFKIEIKSIVPPDAQELKQKIESSIRSAKKVKSEASVSRLNQLSDQLNNESGSADGKMMIQNTLRYEMLLIYN
ncbi:MAG: Hsp70 family protein, partial [Cyclobacteriaceae bacterium]|nr:Hsp70 family protein [Cyclobacteriaceae bacterium]